MDFFNKAKESLKNAGAAVSQKANEVSNTVSLSMKIKESEKEIKECQMEIGKLMVEEHFEELSSICPDICDRIKELQDQIEKVKKELAIAKGELNDDSQEEKAVVCPNCGQTVEGGAFCPNCGTKVL